MNHITKLKPLVPIERNKAELPVNTKKVPHTLHNEISHIKPCYSDIKKSANRN